MKICKRFVPFAISGKVIYSSYMNTNESLEILKKHTTKINLIKHALAVSASMRHFAKLRGEDAEYWACVGMLHDVDYEKYPDAHCDHTRELLEPEGFDEKFIRSILSHGYELRNDIEPGNYMEWVLSTIDQLTGFITACALILPDRKLGAVTMDSIRKRWKVPSFAAGTNRERIMRYCEKLGHDFDYMAEQTLVAMKGIAGELGL